jgi:branched-chain amino acid transport system permease protein
VSFVSRERLYTIVAALLLLAMVVMYRVDHSRLAKVLAAIRQDEVLAQSVGMNAARYRMGAFVIAAFFTAAAGAFSAHYYGVVHPEIWGLWPSIFIMTYAIIGGVRSVFGPVVGATVGVLVVEVLRPAEGLQGIFLGFALMIVVFVLPGGLTSIVSKETVGRIAGRLSEVRSLGRAAWLRRSAQRGSDDAIGRGGTSNGHVTGSGLQDPPGDRR